MIQDAVEVDPDHPLIKHYFCGFEGYGNILERNFGNVVGYIDCCQVFGLFAGGDTGNGGCRKNHQEQKDYHFFHD